MKGILYLLYYFFSLTNIAYCDEYCDKNLELCFLGTHISTYPTISQGKTRIPGVNDGEEFELVHVSQRKYWPTYNPSAKYARIIWPIQQL